ncbi:MAG: hypothetical protein ACLGSD_01215 [Acidobacteriota bacterium]
MRIELVPLYRDIGMHTRYTAANIVLLIVGLLLSVVDFAWTGLVLAHVHGPDHGWLRVGIDSLALIAAFAVVSMLLAWRWPKLASTILWTLTFFYFFVIVAVHVFLPLLIPAILLGVTSAAASLVEHFSGISRSAEIEPQA